MLRCVVFILLVLTLSGCRPVDDAIQTLTQWQRVHIEKIIKEYLTNNPQILLDTTKALQQQRLAELQKKALAAVPFQADHLFRSSASPILGNPQGEVVLVEFMDYQCSHCKTSQPILMRLMKDNPNLRIVIKELPIFGLYSEMAAKAALAAQQQGKFAAFHTALLNTVQPLNEIELMRLVSQAQLDPLKLKKDMQSKDYFFEIKDNFALAKELGISGTPAFLIATQTQSADPNHIRAYFLPGAVSLETFQKAIDALRSPK